MMAAVPTTAAGSPWARLWQGMRWASDPLGVGHGPLSPANGVRAGIIFLVPFLLALPGDSLDGSTNVGIAGLLVTLTDVGGPRRVRVALMALSTVWITIAVVLGVLAGVGPLWLQVVLLLVLVTGVATWSAIGAIGITAALAATLAAISGLAYQDDTVAWETGAQFAIGGAWAIAVALAMPWVNPERRALRRTQAALAGVADHLDAVRGTGRATAAATEAAAAQAVRAARGAIAGLSNRGGTIASSRLLLLVREAARTLQDAGSVAGGADGRGDRGEDSDALLTASAQALRAVGLTVAEEDERVDVDRLQAAIAQLPPTHDGAVEGAIARRVAATAQEGFVWDAALLPLRGVARGDSVGSSPVARQMRRFALLRSLFSPRSIVFRYAVRLGTAVALAYGIGVAINPDFGQLAAVGALPVLQPNVGGTLREGLKHSLSVIILIALAAGVVMVVARPGRPLGDRDRPRRRCLRARADELRRVRRPAGAAGGDRRRHLRARARLHRRARGGLRAARRRRRDRGRIPRVPRRRASRPADADRGRPRHRPRLSRPRPRSRRVPRGRGAAPASRPRSRASTPPRPSCARRASSAARPTLEPLETILASEAELIDAAAVIRDGRARRRAVRRLVARRAGRAGGRRRARAGARSPPAAPRHPGHGCRERGRARGGGDRRRHAPARPVGGRYPGVIRPAVAARSVRDHRYATSQPDDRADRDPERGAGQQAHAPHDGGDPPPRADLLGVDGSGDAPGRAEGHGRRFPHDGEDPAAGACTCNPRCSARGPAAVLAAPRRPARDAGTPGLVRARDERQPRQHAGRGRPV